MSSFSNLVFELEIAKIYCKTDKINRKVRAEPSQDLFWKNALFEVEHRRLFQVFARQDFEFKKFDLFDFD